MALSWNLLNSKAIEINILKTLTDSHKKPLLKNKNAGPIGYYFRSHMQKIFPTHINQCACGNKKIHQH